MIWIIEDNFDDDNLLSCELIKQNVSHYIIPFDRYGYRDLRLTLSFDSDIMAHGSIGFIDQLYNMGFDIPCTFNNYKCNVYYSHFGKYLLNTDYVMMPLIELPRKINQLNGCDFIDSNCCFIRPNSGRKSFIGHLINFKDIQKEVDLLSDLIDGDSIIIVAPQQNIRKEWRFVICNHEVITGCQYKPHQIDGYTNEAYNLAHIIAKNCWCPDWIYTIDVCETANDKMRLMEINSFCCAGLYRCDKEVIVKAVENYTTRR